MAKILYFVSKDAYFYSHRINLAKESINEGFEVAIVCQVYEHQSIIEQAGIKVFPLKFFRRTSLNPFGAITSLYELHKIVKEYQPDIIHNVAMKPVVFGTIIGRYNRVKKIINAFAGLGTVFAKKNIKMSSLNKIKVVCIRFFLTNFFRIFFPHSKTQMILQNIDDIDVLMKLKCLSFNQVHLIPGAGVSLKEFPFTAQPEKKIVKISMASRLLWDKGVGELVEASILLKAWGCPCEIFIYGDIDKENPSSIDEKTLERWQQQTSIHWMGYTNNVASAYISSNIIVLPSYHEGLPKTLLEAASIGRPIVTTDVSGCKDVVIDGVTGYVVPPRDSLSLAHAIKRLVDNKLLRITYGINGRKRVKDKFSDKIIHEETISLYKKSIL